MTTEAQPQPQDQSPQPLRLNPLDQAEANEQRAEALEKIASDPKTPRRQAKFLLQQAKSERAASALRKKQAAWEAENPPPTLPQPSNSPPAPSNPPSDNQADFNL